MKFMNYSEGFEDGAKFAGLNKKEEEKENTKSSRSKVAYNS